MSLQHSFDDYIATKSQKLPRTILPLMDSLSILGNPSVVLTAGLAGYLGAVERHQAATKSAFIYAGVAYGLCVGLKLVLKRARPNNLDIRTLGLQSYSFPSGHAFGTVVIYGLFSYLDIKYLASPWNLLSAGLIWALIILIGVSRVFLKSHYASDVAGGWLLGSLALWAVVSLSF